MSPEPLDSSSFSEDALDFLALLSTHQVKYLIVGGEAVIYYGHVRLTGDIDFLYEVSEDNAKKLFGALSDFWDGNIPELGSQEELLKEGLVLQFGLPPNRIDLISSIGAVEFGEAWERREDVQVFAKEAITIHFIGLGDLIRNKESAGRPKDLDDLAYLIPLSRQKRDR
ncbi:DUF6036 family nucleotidyltransferase [Planctomycetota bacterium]